MSEPTATHPRAVFLPAVKSLWKREVLRFVRQRSRWIGALATPIMFWLVIGGGLQRSFHDPGSPTGGGYFQFFFPGAISLSVLFTAIFSTISVIEDRHQGFLQGVLVSPITRASIVVSKVLGGATLGLIQGLLLLLLAPFVGFHLGLVQLVEVIVFLFLMASALTTLGFLFAWRIDSIQGYHSIMNLVLFPMWLLSGSVFPIAGSHIVFRWLSRINPMTYAVGAIRSIFMGGPMHNLLGPALVLIGFTLVVFFLAVVAVGKPSKRGL